MLWRLLVIFCLCLPVDGALAIGLCTSAFTESPGSFSVTFDKTSERTGRDLEYHFIVDGRVEGFFR